MFLLDAALPMTNEALVYFTVRGVLFFALPFVLLALVTLLVIRNRRK